jgi:ATP-dependent exoDNAse (exonuclease V) alpha subunit
MDITMADLDPEQKHALELMLEGRSVFLTGKAGSGKSCILRLFSDLAPRNAVYLAPTGLAALNIGGSTVHRFLGLPAAFLPPGHLHTPEPVRQDAILAAETIVLDEVSMVRSDTMQCLADTLASLPLPGGQGRPFGGRQVIVCGDLYQLPPVVSSGTEYQLLKEHFGGAFPFHTAAWKTALFENVSLEHPHRQGMEREFVVALDRIRTGLRECAGSRGPIDWVNRHAHICRAPRSATVLCTTRARAAAFNTMRDAELRSPVFPFEGTTKGPFDERSCPADAHLELRMGSRVMLLANGAAADGTEYANGNTGVVTEIEPDGPTVDVLLDDGRTVSLGPHCWLEQEYRLVKDPETGEEKPRLVTVASFEQLPLKLAYAITIHKSQGMSLDRVHVDLGTGVFAGGQLYVALSRCRSIDGLSLARPLRPADVLISMDVASFHE